MGMGIRGKLCELVAVGPGGSGVRMAKPDITRSRHRGRDSFTFLPLGVKVQSDVHY